MKFWEEFKASGSTAGILMTESREKSKADLFDENTGKLKKERDKLEKALLPITEKEGTKGHERKTATNAKNEAAAKEKIALLESEKEKIEAMSDEPPLSQTAKSFLKKWLLNKIYGKRFELESKAIKKGKAVEDRAIDQAAVHFGWPIDATKNTERFSDDELHGEPDVIIHEKKSTKDTKCSYTHETFPLLESELPEKEYWWQGQVYMALLRFENHSVVYCLMNMPDEMIEQEKRWRLSVLASIEDEKRFEDNFVYENLPDELRFKSFDFEFDFDSILRLRKRVHQCRAYLKTLCDELPKSFNQ